MTLKTVISLIEGKGGVGKSTTSALTVHALSDDGKRNIAIFDADTTNSTMASMFEHVTMFDPHQPEAAGVMAQMCQDTNADAAVIDTGARSEARMMEVLRRVVPSAKKHRVQLVVIRPVTLSSFAQANAVNFVAAMAPLGIRVILARILAQGRTVEHYVDWQTSRGRAEAMKLGAVEIDITDVGVRWGDEVPAFGISFHDVAAGNFTRVEPALRPSAERIFTPSIQCHIALWIEENAAAIMGAIVKLGIKL